LFFGCFYAFHYIPYCLHTFLKFSNSFFNIIFQKLVRFQNSIEYMLDPVTVEDQNAVFRLPTSHTGVLTEIEPADPHMLRKPGPQAARCTNDKLHQSTWEEYMPDLVLFEGQNASF